jgi:hypothetical protein
MQSEELEEPETSDLVSYLTEHHEEQLKEVQKSIKRRRRNWKAR